MQEGATDSISLRDAPARFLTADWDKLVGLSGSTVALHVLSKPDPPGSTFYRRQVIGAGLSSPGHLRAEEASLVSEEITAAFKAACASAKLIGSGIFSNTGLRQDILAEAWKDLVVDFGSNQISAAWGCYNFVKVRAAPCHDDLHARLVAWLNERLAERGPELKKILTVAAKMQFEGTYRDRAFNDAYRDVYGHARGRPPAPEKINK